MCRTKDTMKKTELGKKLNMKNNLVKLTTTSKAKNYNNFSSTKRILLFVPTTDQSLYYQTEAK